MHKMECNRDEAVRARDIAEKKYALQDFAGAKKFVLKAQQLFPGLEGLSQMLPVMEIHSVAQVKVAGGEMDWYGLLQVEPGADDSLIKKQYRKLALLLHPDKNKAVGAEAAFKLIGEAFGILSDKTKRQLHDMRRGVKMKVAAPGGVPPGEHNVNFPTSYHVAPGSGPAPSTASTFWTSCPRCKMQYQYLRTYENYQLQCHKCKELFKARDIKGSNGGYAWAPYAEAHRQDFNFAKMAGAFNGPNGFMNGPFQHPFPTKQPQAPSATAGVFSRAAAAAAAASKVAAAAAAASTPVPSGNIAENVVQQTFQKVKRDRVEAEKETKRKEKEQRKRENEERRKELKKQREAQRKQEAMDRLISKKRENDSKINSKRKLETKPTRRLKRRRRGSELDDDEEVEEEDLKLVDEEDDREQPAVGEIPRRRSARAKKNVSTYKVDNSDSEIEDFPASKRTKSEDETDSDNSERVSPEEKTVRNLASHQTENGGAAEKGKSVAHDEKWAGRINGVEAPRPDAKAEQKEGSSGGMESKDSYNGARDVPDKGPCRQEKVDTTMRQEDRTGSLYGHDTGVNQRSKSNRSASKAQSSSIMDEKSRFHNALDQEERKDVKVERDEKSPCKSPSSTLRTRSKSTESNKKPVLNTPSLREEVSKVERKLFQSSSTETSPSALDDRETGIDVPDPDFNDFDGRRTETDIIAGQVWALYDDEDGMPRFYARVSRVSLSPFRVHLCWLEPTAATEQSNTWLEGTGLTISCGEFKVGTVNVTDQINVFSHLVLDKVGKGLVKILPRKGEVWAIYKDWDQGPVGPKRISKSKGGGYTYAYEMVEVLSDYTEEKGCKVVKLAKVRGFRTLFHQVEGSAAQKQFRSPDLPKFSHCVISVKMCRDEALGVPPAALELDPAATPLDLILGSSAR